MELRKTVISTEQNSENEKGRNYIWSRAGEFELPWGPYDTFESLAFSPALRDKLCRLSMGLAGGKGVCKQMKTPWRYGCYLFGPAGVGKSAAGRAVALLLGWNHIEISDREILDAHHLSRALASVTHRLPAVVTIENIDEILKRVDSRDFFAAFDDISSRLDGVFWLTTSRHSEVVPKNLLVRPGRFDEALRLNLPTNEVRAEYFSNYLRDAFLDGESGDADMKAAQVSEKLRELVSLSENFTFAHLHEMRQLAVSRMVHPTEELQSEALLAYCRDQAINAERWSGRSDSKLDQDVDERLALMDPRLVLAALQVTDVFKKIIEVSMTAEEEAK